MDTPRTTKQWRCYHCDEVFTEPMKARAHFGDTIGAEPACQIEVKEGLAQRVRIQEALLTRYRAEDSDTDRAMHGMRADHTTALVRAEEEGYAKGLKDYTAVEQRAERAESRLAELQVKLDIEQQVSKQLGRLVADKDAGRIYFRDELKYAQSRIDALMLEHCPDEMTEAQMAAWAAAQQGVAK